MDTDRASDEELMLRVAGGRREPLGRLVRRHGSPLLTFIQRMIGDRHRSEELFQEVFLAVWDKRRSYRYPKRFRPWLFGIALNKCKADIRRWSSRAQVIDCPGDCIADNGPSPVQAAVAAETAAIVTEAIARLPAAQRAVVVLRVYNDLKFREIAQVVGRAEPTVRSQMCHALTTIRKYLQPRLNRDE